MHIISPVAVSPCHFLIWSFCKLQNYKNSCYKFSASGNKNPAKSISVLATLKQNISKKIQQQLTSAVSFSPIKYYKIDFLNSEITTKLYTLLQYSVKQSVQFCFPGGEEGHGRGAAWSVIQSHVLLISVQKGAFEKDKQVQRASAQERPMAPSEDSEDDVLVLVGLRGLTIQAEWTGVLGDLTTLQKPPPVSLVDAHIHPGPESW
jgi:hypothetical protein